MPTFKRPKAIHVKVTSGTGGQYVKVTNFTSGGTFTGVLNSSKEVVITPTTAYTWSDGDVIQIEMIGKIQQTSRTTISGGGKSVTLGNAADTTTSAVSL